MPPKRPHLRLLQPNPSTGEEAPEQPAIEDMQFVGGQTPQALAVTQAQEGFTPEHEEQDNAIDSGEATNEGGVKTFTAFIEEFRQAEARFGRAVQEAREAQENTDIQASATSFTPSAPISSVEEVFVPEFTMPWETPHIVATPTIESTEETTLTTEPKASVEENLTTQPTTSVEAPENVETTQTPEATETAAPTARPVSPLLRPASRLRLPRHNSRHREEARTPAADVTNQPGQSDQPEPHAEQAAQTGSTSEPTVNPAETTPTEQPRPARRYRFDNHSKTAPAASTTPIPATVPTDTGLTNGHTQTAQPVERETLQVNPTSTIAHQPEQTVAKSTPDADTVAENTGATQLQPATEPERRRKQHGQERQRGKEQATPQATQATQSQQPPATVAEIATTLNAQQAKPTVVEPVAEQKENIQPEDLPPLEYADLQKANTRRRRRRHTNGASVATLTGNTLPTTPEIPVVTPATPVAPVIQPRSIATPPPTVPQRPLVTPATAVPPRPAASAAMPQRPAATPPSAVTTNQAPFTITSGYTVNQMNQGSDNVGPFMGPDPSPARGTMAAQNMRSIRTDAQRTPAYPVRTTEATSASVNQLANIVSQAISNTDRPHGGGTAAGEPGSHQHFGFDAAVPIERACGRLR